MHTILLKDYVTLLFKPDPGLQEVIVNIQQSLF
jgi:hypothetical protein